MPYDAQHALEHPEVAAWALGALDPDDATAFQKHLQSCEQCQREVAEFAPVAQSLTLAAPAAKPPPELELKTIAAVQYAVMAESRPEPVPVAAATVVPAPEVRLSSTTKAIRWWHLHWTNPLLSVVTALGAAAVTAAAFIGIQVFQVTAPAVAASFNLKAQPGQTGSATATARHAGGGWQVQLTVTHLKKLGKGQFYECWYAGPNNQPGHPELITAGTFTGTNGTFKMWSAADPAEFKIMQITAEQPGDASQHGNVVLSGTADASA
jgi:Anti-sigma-K factor rskA, C-terminal/Putative zinc-finger